MSSEIVKTPPKGNEIVRNRAGLERMLSSDAFREMVTRVLPKHLTEERMTRLALLAATRNPKIFECTAASIARAIMQASEMGLCIDSSGVLGGAYLVPYGKDCTLIADYRGLINLARRSGKVKAVSAHAVRQKDEFDYQLGDSPSIHHKPYWYGDAGDIIGAYAVAKLDADTKQMDFMTRPEIEKIRKLSKRANAGPWKDHYPEMAKKTVIRRLAKLLPLSPEAAAAIATLDENEGYDFGGQIVDSIAEKPGVDGVVEILEQGENKQMAKDGRDDEGFAAAVEAGEVDAP